MDHVTAFLRVKHTKRPCRRQHAAHDFLDNMVSQRGQDSMIERFVFADLRELFAKANEEKSGDQLAGVAARSERERVAAKIALADVPLAAILASPLIDPDADEVSRAILDGHDAAGFATLRGLTVGEFRELLLDDATSEDDVRRLHRAITPEMAAAVAKLMGNKDLILVA